MKNKIINGTERLTDLSEPEQILSSFYKAFNNKDIAGLRNNWATNQDVMVYNPGGGLRQSWDEIERIYKAIFSAPVDVKAQFCDYSIVNLTAVFIVYGNEKVTVARGMDKPKMIDIRITRIYKLIEGAWKQIHLHGSIDQPELLKTYQEATRP
jgi:hypothetical protein